MRKYRYKRANSLMLALVMIIALAFSGQGMKNTSVSASSKPSVDAKSYVVMDANTGEILYSKYKNKKVYPASTTKIMTALVALEYLETTDKIKYTKKMATYVSSPDISKFYLPVGSNYTVQDYLYMLLLKSDASSASALAVGTAGSFADFADLMNAKAEELGMKHTHFDNPVGIDIGNGYNNIYTTAGDFAILCRAAMANSTIRKIVSSNYYKVPKSKRAAFSISNTNMFYHGFYYNKSSYKMIGTKTGYTGAAGYTMLSTGRDSAGHEVIVAYFGAKTNYNKYTGVSKLMNYTFSEYAKGNIELKLGFYDTRLNEYEKDIVELIDDGVITMSSNGKYYPNRKITAADFKKYFKKMMDDKISISGDTVTTGQYIKAYNKLYDVEETIDSLKAEGYLPEELSDSLNHKLSRAEAASIINRLSYEGNAGYPY